MLCRDAIKILRNRYKINTFVARVILKLGFTDARQKRQKFKKMTENEFLWHLKKLEAEGAFSNNGWDFEKIMEAL